MAAACFGPGIWVFLIDSMRKDLNAPYGELSSNSLAIRDPSIRGGYILLPLEEIDRAELVKKSTVNVFLIDRKEPVSIAHVKDPNSFIDAVNAAASPNQKKNTLIK